MKARSHELIIRVNFNKPCTLSHARLAARDCIHGDFYPTAIRPEDPDKFTVSRRWPARKNVVRP